VARAIYSPNELDEEEDDSVHEYNEDELADSSYIGSSSGRGERPRSVEPGSGGSRGVARETTGTRGTSRPTSARVSRDPTVRMQ
jgi:hypothetical protein